MVGKTNKPFSSPGCRYPIRRMGLILAFALQVLPELDTQKALSTGLGYKASTNTNQECGSISQRGQTETACPDHIADERQSCDSNQGPLAPIQAFPLADTGRGRAKDMTIVGEDMWKSWAIRPG